MSERDPEEIGEAGATKRDSYELELPRCVVIGLLYVVLVFLAAGVAFAARWFL